MASSSLVLVVLVVLRHSGVAAEVGSVGYCASFSQPGTVAGTRTPILDATATPALAALSEGFTLMAWIRFRDTSPNVFQPSLQLLTTSNANFMQPWGGMHDGFEFNSAAPATVSTLGASAAASWHHYAVSWNATSSERLHVVDGKLLSSTTHSGDGLELLADSPYVVLGMNCYPSSYLARAEHPECNPDHQLDGQVDDVALFAGGPPGSPSTLCAKDPDGLSASSRVPLPQPSSQVASPQRRWPTVGTPR